MPVTVHVLRFTTVRASDSKGSKLGTSYAHICIMMSCAQAVQTKYVLTLEPTSHVPVHSKLESLEGLTGRVTLGSRLQDFKLLPVPCAAIMNHWQPLTCGLGISGTAVCGGFLVHP